MQSVIAGGKAKFYITEIGTDQIDGETGTLEQRRLQKPRHSSINYGDSLWLWALWLLIKCLIPGIPSLQEVLY